ncbi:hypothetical protein V6N13_065497 [Hibiscus sabdariffa]
MPDYAHSPSVHSTYPTQPDEIPGFTWGDLRCHSRTSTWNTPVWHPSAACTTLQNLLRKNLLRAQCLVQCLINPNDIDVAERTRCQAKKSCMATFSLATRRPSDSTTFAIGNFRVISVDSPDVVSFRLLGQYFQLTISDFNFLMGFVTDVTDPSHLTALLEMSQDFDADFAYESLTGLAGISYNPRSTKGWKIQEPVLRYIHRFLT